MNDAHIKMQAHSASGSPFRTLHPRKQISLAQNCIEIQTSMSNTKSNAFGQIVLRNTQLAALLGARGVNGSCVHRAIHNVKCSAVVLVPLFVLCKRAAHKDQQSVDFRAHESDCNPTHSQHLPDFANQTPCEAQIDESEIRICSSKSACC